MIPLFKGSRIDTPKAFETFLDYITAEIEDMSEIFTLIHEDKQAKISNRQTRYAMYVANLADDVEMLDVLEPDELRFKAQAMFEAVKALVDDEQTRFGNDEIYPRLKAVIRRDKPILKNENSDFAP